MQITPSFTSVGRLFTDQYIFRVPKYQRNYAWSYEHISDFISDLRKCHARRSQFNRSRSHFFGGIVSVEQKMPGSARRQCDLVDGQQRIATFILLVSALVSIYRSLKTDAAQMANSDDEKLIDQRLRDLTQKYLKYEDEVNRQIMTIDRLEVSGADRQFFRDVINGYSPAETRDSHHRIWDAYQRIKNYMVEEIVEPLPSLSDKLDALKRFEEILNEDFTVIHIVTETKRDAYRLFQVLNDRGTGLTEGDLLRSKTMELLESSSFALQQSRVEEAWDNILADSYSVTEDYLRWFFSSHKGKRPGQTSLLDEFLDDFFPQHKNDEEIAQSALEADAIMDTVCQLQEEVDVMRRLAAGDWPYPNQQPITQWDRDRLRLLIVELQHTNCMPLLLAAARKLNHVAFAEIVQTLERFVFRYKIVCNKHISPVTRIYLEQAQAIRANPEQYRVPVLSSKLRSLITSEASDPIFASNLREEMEYRLRASNKPLKYFLMTLEHYSRWYKDGAQGSPECRDRNRVFDFANTTIEHIYPQNPSTRNPELDDLVNDLGNLTFLGPEDNQDAGNADFAVKKPIFRDSLVSLNNDIASLPNWDKASLEQRQRDLVEMALKVFAV